MTDMAELESWWAERRRKELEAAKEESEEWFAAHPGEDPPELSFETPRCSVCNLYTMYDDGQFICDVCRCVWGQNGYFSERWDD